MPIHRDASSKTLGPILRSPGAAPDGKPWHAQKPGVLVFQRKVVDENCVCVFSAVAQALLGVLAPSGAPSGDVRMRIRMKKCFVGAGKPGIGCPIYGASLSYVVRSEGVIVEQEKRCEHEAPRTANRSSTHVRNRVGQRVACLFIRIRRSADPPVFIRPLGIRILGRQNAVFMAEADKVLILRLSPQLRGFARNRPELMIARDPKEPGEFRSEGAKHEMQVVGALPEVAPKNEPVVRVRRNAFQKRAVLGEPHMQVANGPNLHFHLRGNYGRVRPEARGLRRVLLRSALGTAVGASGGVAGITGAMPFA